ncbi:M56 family metallopeptidase [Rhabdothermincola sediminis]|uniref:M56 family metallopeptidase n=1 Tax=Rhabdothermincola sediminis TaxID=2751370 RepID=UPI001AA0252E|nr:M56 family metallopeptidase [Rhabdothermincola sediminis]
MNVLLVAPLLLVVAGVAAGWFLPRVTSPASSVRVLTVATVVAAAGVAAALALVVLAGASELHDVSSWLGWCDALYPGDHGAAPWAGALAAALLVVAARRARRYLSRSRAEMAAFAAVEGVEVIAAAGAVAFAVPGSPGGVILGDELVRTLSRDERQAVIAHEHAHLDHGHHRYVHAVETCAAAFPFLVPLARQVRFNTERWADETAASAVGSRTLVARAIARVALLGAPSPAPGVLGFRSLSAAARVEALLRPSTPVRLTLPAAASTMTIVTTLAGSSVQLHHLVFFLDHACR